MWKCPNCETLNDDEKEECLICGENKPNEPIVPEPAPFVPEPAPFVPGPAPVVPAIKRNLNGWCVAAFVISVLEFCYVAAMYVM